MGDVDGSIGAWGFARGGMGAVVEGDRRRVQGRRRRDPSPTRRRRAHAGARRQGHRRRAGERRRVPREDRRLQPRPEAHLPRSSSTRRTCRPTFVKRARDFKIRGSSGKLNIALDGLPEFPALGRDNPLPPGDMHFLDSLERCERAYDDWKAARWSQDPYLDLLIPSMIDPTMAPPGKHFMSVFVQYVPPKVHGRDWTDADRDAFGDTVIDADRALQPELQEPDPARRGAHAARARERGRPHRGQHLPGRADDGPAAVQPAVPGLRAVPRAGARACTCAAPARIPAAASWARPAPTPRAKSCTTCADRAQCPRAGKMTDRDRIVIVGARPQRPGLRRVSRQARAARSLVLEAARSRRRRGGDARVRARLPGVRVRAPAVPARRRRRARAQSRGARAQARASRA